MGSRGANPTVYLFRSPLAGGKNDVSAAVGQGQTHSVIKQFAGNRFRFVAVVVFQVVHAPLGKLPRVLKFMLKAGRIPGAGAGAAAAVHTEFQAFAVDIVRNVFHAVGEFFRVSYQISLTVPLFERPAVINHQILVSGSEQTAFRHPVGGGKDQFLTDVFCKCIPTVPAHRRCCTEGILFHSTYQLSKLFRVHRVIVGVLKVPSPLPAGRDKAANKNLYFCIFSPSRCPESGPW